MRSPLQWSNGKITDRGFGRRHFRGCDDTLVLDLKLPEGTKMSNDPAVWRQLFEMTGRFSTYALSFIVPGKHRRPPEVDP